MGSSSLPPTVRRIACIAGLSLVVASLGWLVGRQLPLSWSPPARTNPPQVTTLPAAAEPSLAEQIAAVRAGKGATIQVESRPLSDADLAELASLSQLQVLLLDHGDNSITDAGAARLAKPGGLVHLRIRGGAIGDRGLAELAKLPHLRILNLPQCQCTDLGIASLAQVPRLSQLRLGSPHVTDRAMNELRRFPSLRQLHWIDVPLSDAGLAELAQLKQLESLYLDGGRFSDEGIARLLKQRPDLHLHLNQQHHDRDPQRGHHHGP